MVTGSSSRAEVTLLAEVDGTVLRGAIDLLVQKPGAAPLIVDYKTDRLDGEPPAEGARRYELQRSIYSLAVAGALGVDELEVAYVFLERPEEPVITAIGPAELDAARKLVEDAVGRARAAA